MEFLKNPVTKRFPAISMAISLATCSSPDSPLPDTSDPFRCNGPAFCSDPSDLLGQSRQMKKVPYHGVQRTTSQLLRLAMRIAAWRLACARLNTDTQPQAIRHDVSYQLAYFVFHRQRGTSPLLFPPASSCTHRCAKPAGFRRLGRGGSRHRPESGFHRRSAEGKIHAVFQRQS